MESKHKPAIHVGTARTAAVRHCWVEVALHEIWPLVLSTATHVLAIVTKDLKLDEVALRFFEPAFDDVVHPSPSDVALAVLNAPPYDSSMTGRIVPPHIAKHPMVIWVRTGLPPPGVTFVVAYECRHLQQCLYGHIRECDYDAAMEDAEVYALQEAPLEKGLMNAVWQWYVQALIDGGQQGGLVPQQ